MERDGCGYVPKGRPLLIAGYGAERSARSAELASERSPKGCALMRRATILHKRLVLRLRLSNRALSVAIAKGGEYGTYAAAFVLIVLLINILQLN